MKPNSTWQLTHALDVSDPLGWFRSVMLDLAAQRQIEYGRITTREDLMSHIYLHLALPSELLYNMFMS